MKKTIAIILLVMILLCSIPISTIAATGVKVPVSSSDIVYTGRWIPQTDGTLTANFNAGLEMRFTGTAIAVNLKASSGIAYSIDDGAWQNVKGVSGQYTLASGLSAGTHTLEMTVAFHDTHIYLEGFTLDAGSATVSPLDKPTIEFIGDSITAGWIGSGYDRYNYVSNTYGFIAAENLDLYHDTVAFGGIAVVPGYGSPDSGGMENRYNLISEYVAGESNVPKWDKSTYIPDYIVINLGTNDTAAASEFSKYYEQFLVSLKDSYPSTKIVAMVPFNGAYRGAISNVVSKLNDNNVFFLDTAGWVESTMTTDGVHLTAEAQSICGNYLTTALSNLINRGTLENADGTPIAPETTGKYYYTNFENGLSSSATLSGNGSHKIYVFENLNTTYSVSKGELQLSLPNGGRLRLSNTINNLSRFKYFVIRVKGTVPAGAQNAFTFNFGSYSTPGATFAVSAESVTSEYNDLVFSMPDGYFDDITTAYEATLFIHNAGTPTVNLTIDEMYFTDKYPADDDSSDVESGFGDKVYYNDFNSGLSTTPTATGNGDNTAYVVAALDTLGEDFEYTCANGALNAKIGVDYQLRIQNSMTGLENYKYMVLRMKGSYEYPYGELTGNALGFWFGSYSTGKTANLYMTVDQLTADYSEVVIEIPEGYFDGVGADYASCLCITSNRGSGNIFFDVSIDEIYFCNDATDGGNDDESEPIITGTAYSEFTDALVLGTPVSNGAGGTITLFGTDLATQSVSDGNLNVSFEAQNAYIRFTSSVTLTEDCATSKYKYMIMRLKGLATQNGQAVTSGSLLKIIFGSWGNEANPLYVDISQVNADEFTTVVFELSNANFAATHADYKTGLILRNPGNFSSQVVIDSIYFSDEEPSAPSEPEEEVKKVYYNDFNSGLSETPTPTGNGSNTAYVFGVDGATYACADGVLNINMTNGNYLRIQNTMTGISNYKYMVVRMKGTNSWAAGLTGNSIGFWFGSYGTPGAKLYVPAEQLTADYSDVVIEIPAGYFDSIADDYKACMFITTERGAVFDIYIDEIYFINNLGGDSSHTHNVKYGVCTECGETLYVSGDANGDTVVDVRDLVRIKKIAVSLEAKTDAADVNSDGTVNSEDTVVLKRGLLNGDSLAKSAEVSFEASSVKMLGRIGGTDTQGRLVLEWTDAGFEFNFTGTGFKFDVAGNSLEERFRPYIAYTVDGGEAVKTRVESTSAATIAVNGLTYGTHTVKILRINEPINNPIYVSSVSVESDMYGTGVALLAPNAAYDKKILFIGDSITTGYGNIGTGNHPFDTADQDGMQTYAYLAAEYFGADAMYVAREGRGIVNNSYNSEDSIVTMLNKKSLVLGTAYDYTSWTPDIIFINAGTNDVTGGTTADAMTTGSISFLNSLRDMYPNAKIIWGYGAMGTATQIKTGITSAVNTVNDSNITYFEFSPCSGGGTYGHPDVEDHVALSEELIAELKSVMGW